MRSMSRRRASESSSYVFARRLGVWCLPVVLAFGCRGTTASTPVAKGYVPVALAPLTDAPTTKEITFAPRTPRAAIASGPNPGLPEPLADYLGRGFGELDPGPGDP